MQNSGEQFVPGMSSPRLLDEHLARYEFAKQFCRGKEVLDVACGTGYGSYELAEVAEHVMGVDLSEESISFAKNNYQKDNLAFVQGNGITVPFEKRSFDVVISFETIEHLHEAERTAFYKNLSASLKDNGVLVFSTPNKMITSPYTDKPLNPFHVIEFSKKDLTRELEQSFAIEGWYGQRFVPRILTYKIVRKAVRLFEVVTNLDIGLYTTFYPARAARHDRRNSILREPRVMIVVLRKNENSFHHEK